MLKYEDLLLHDASAALAETVEQICSSRDDDTTVYRDRFLKTFLKYTFFYYINY